MVLTRRGSVQLQRMSETHRSYHALKYRLMFWQGDDGYYISLKMINPLTGKETPAKIEAKRLLFSFKSIPTTYGRRQVFQALSTKFDRWDHRWQRWLSIVSASII